MRIMKRKNSTSIVLLFKVQNFLNTHYIHIYIKGVSLQFLFSNYASVNTKLLAGISTLNFLFEKTRFPTLEHKKGKILASKRKYKYLQ